MTDPDRNAEQAVREAAYFIWEGEGCPEGRALDHWLHATSKISREERRRVVDEPVGDEEKIMAGRADANIPALLTKDVRGG